MRIAAPASTEIDELDLEARLDADRLFDDDELDDASDPFEILAKREELAGAPLYFLNLERH